MKADTIATRFEASLNAYRSREGRLVALRPAEQEILELAVASCIGRPFGNGAQELLQAATRHITKQWLSTTIRSMIEGVAASCGSVIEVALCLAIAMIGKAKNYAVLFDFGHCISGDPEGDITVRVRPQVRFGEFRVDFLVSMVSIEGAAEAVKVHQKLAIVECDGFTFHDATRERACRDKQRDRYLQSLGLPVLRFAGSEIWADVFACADGVLGFLLDGIKAQTLSAVPRKRPAGVAPTVLEECRR